MNGESKFAEAKSLNDNADEIKHPSDVIGSWGPTQKRVVLYLILIYTIAPFSNSTFVYIAPSNVDFYCVHVNVTTNETVYLKNACTIANTSDSEPCKVFKHDTSFHKRTLVNRFDLVCDKSWYPSLGQSIHQIGYAVSGVLIGFISDKRGRFFAAKISIALEIVAGFGQGFAPSIYWYWFARFFVGIAAYGRYLNGYILVSEWVGPKMRGKVASSVYELGGYVGSLFFLASFYFYPDYVAIEVTARIVEVFMFVGYIFVVKESPRWLLTHGKWDEAAMMLKSAAQERGKYDDEEIDRRIKKLKDYTMREQQKLESKTSSSIFEVWKDPKLLKTSVILYFSWFSLAFIGYASGLNVGQLGGSVYGIALFGKLTWPLTLFVAYYCISRFERKTLGRTCLYFMVIGLFGSMLCALHSSLFIPLILISRFYKTCGSLVFKTLYLLSTEFFPTTMRQTSMGVCSVFARLGSIIAPFIKELTIATSLWVPFAIFTALTVITAILWTFLPETMDIQLPDNILQTIQVDDEQQRVVDDLKTTKRRSSSVTAK